MLTLSDADVRCLMSDFRSPPPSALLWMVFNFILTLTSLAITHERVPDTAPLPDIVLDTVPTGAWALKVSDPTAESSRSFTI